MLLDILFAQRFAKLFSATSIYIAIKQVTSHGHLLSWILNSSCIMHQTFHVPLPVSYILHHITCIPHSSSCIQLAWSCLQPLICVKRYACWILSFNSWIQLLGQFIYFLSAYLYHILLFPVWPCCMHSGCILCVINLCAMSLSLLKSLLANIWIRPCQFLKI